MTEPVTREELVKRLADISHATWVLQGVRDFGPAFEHPFGPGNVNRPDSAEDRAAVKDAQALLDGVLSGKPLRELSENHEHWAAPHDLERAELIVTELERLGVFESA